MLNAATQLLESKGIKSEYQTFEISVYNADKPKLDKKILLERLSQFAGRFSIFVTNQAPTFITKAKMFPNSYFVVGYDTAERLLKKQYYNDSEEQLSNAMLELKNKLGCKFLVTGRVVNDRYHTLQDLTLHKEFRDIFLPLDFRVDVSSTQIRQSGGKAVRG